MKDAKIEIRVSSELKTEITKAAHKEGRTVASFVLYSVQKYLEGK